jgi:uncharacterized glyoxalase superfamily protein PhnB
MTDEDNDTPEGAGMSDDDLRRLRPDRGGPVEPHDPSVLAREKERLMSMIDQRVQEPPSPYRVAGVEPRLGYLDEVAALEYLTRVFGFREQREARFGTGVGDDIMFAWLEAGDGSIMVSRVDHNTHQVYSPRELGHATAILNVAVRDIDSHYAHAVAEGADITMELQDAFYGYRRYEATDLEGNRWHFNESLDNVRARGGRVEDRDGDD